jgi:L,D-transpeptidase ErfK/SrfK
LLTLLRSARGEQEGSSMSPLASRYHAALAWHRIRLFVGIGPYLILVLPGCHLIRPAPAPVAVHPEGPVEQITTAETPIPQPRELPGLIGRLQWHRIEPKETLLDTARDAGLGFQQVQDANPTVDEWIPKPGTQVIIPSRWIIPRSRYRGLVINIPEMRLYLFPTHPRPGKLVRLRTWPIGIGTKDAPSPVAGFVVTAKDKNPTWVVPASIRRTMDQPRAVVPAGPDNPLGRYRIRLSAGLYEIHGTDVPWSIGRLTTHGCIRLYPEHIPELYRLVRRGEPGEFVYQPVKFGEEAGHIYVQVHPDLYKRIRNLEAHAFAQARRSGLAARIDPARLRAAVREQNGIPVDITRSDLSGQQSASR